MTTKIRQEVNLDAIPQELKDARQWVVWRLEPKPDKPDKLTKVPYQARNPKRKAMSNTPSTWGTFEQAVACWRKTHDVTGIGLMFAGDLCGVDLDHCASAGELEPWALEYVKRLDTYTEWSQSGAGVHCLAWAALPPKGRKRGQVEMYDKTSPRFFVMTGRTLDGYHSIAYRQAEIEALHTDVFGESELEPRPARSPGQMTLSDTEILAKAVRAKNGAKLKWLWDGNTNGYQSQSEADLALCSLLAFWTGRDPAAMDRLFRQSALMRAKWDIPHNSDGDTYGKMTINAAIKGTSEIYTPSCNGAPVASTGGVDTGDKSPRMPPERTGNSAPAIPPKQAPSDGTPSDSGTEPKAIGQYDNNLNLEAPELPESARLAPHLGADACPWLDDYIEYSHKWSPRSFFGYHEGTALWVLSTIAARRVAFDFGKTRYTNLSLMLVGRTTIHAKSSATDIGKQTLKTCGLSFLLAADEATPQSFIRSLVRNSIPDNFDDLPLELQTRVRMRLAFKAQRGWYHEEFGSGLASMMRADGVMADFRGLLRKWDDCPDDYTRDTIARGVEHVEAPYLALIANLTPADLKPVAKRGMQLWGDGFLARFAFITPPANTVNDERFPKGKRVIPSEISSPLVKWHLRLGVPDVHITDVQSDDGQTIERKRVTVGELPVNILQISNDVWDAYYRYDHAILDIARKSDKTDLDGNYGRLAEKALRIAALFASLGDCDTIALNHWARAQEIVERWRLYTHRLYNQVTELDYSEQKEIEDKLLDTLRRWQGSEDYSNGMTANEIGRFIRGLGSVEVGLTADGLCKVGVLCRHRPKRADKYYIPGVNGLMPRETK